MATMRGGHGNAATSNNPPSPPIAFVFNFLLGLIQKQTHGYRVRVREPGSLVRQYVCAEIHRCRVFQFRISRPSPRCRDPSEVATTQGRCTNSRLACTSMPGCTEATIRSIAFQWAVSSAPVNLSTLTPWMSLWPCRVVFQAWGSDWPSRGCGCRGRDWICTESNAGGCGTSSGSC